jgi:mRNA interferase MazF
VVVQSNDFNDSRISTVVIAVVTSNTLLAAAPGNVTLPKRVSGLRHESVINTSQLLTVDRSLLAKQICQLPSSIVHQVERGLRLVLAL